LAFSQVVCPNQGLRQTYRKSSLSVKQGMPKSAYIHIPFCKHKCDFCDFAVVTNLDARIPDYCQTVAFEIANRLGKDKNHSLETIFYGGGTPGYIDTGELAVIHAALSRHASIDKDAEISLETTPEAITEKKADSWLKLGINRLSIGIESLNDNELSSMGRSHNRTQALKGIQLAKSAGFTNISLDLMYGVPEQTIESWQDSLTELLHFGLPHLSAYAMTLAVNSPLLKRYPLESPKMPSDDLAASMYEILVKTAHQAGLEQYEVSNFAKPDLACRHNMTYWDNEEYFAFGLSAHRYVDSVRSHNWRSFNRYMDDCLGNESAEEITESMRLKEGIILGLRTTAGINVKKFHQRYGIDLLKQFDKQIQEFQSQGLMVGPPESLRLTPQGMLLSNLVLSHFV